jgi:hypothetical protein
VTETADDGPARPLLRVVRGNPAPEELAALLAVVTARGSAVEEPEHAVPSRWAARSTSLRRPLPRGPGAWRASGLPGAH